MRVIEKKKGDFSIIMDGPSAGSFDTYIAEIHDFLDRLREIPDVDERCATLVADLAEAYSEQPSPMQTGRRENFLLNIYHRLKYSSNVSVGFILWTKEYFNIPSTC